MIPGNASPLLLASAAADAPAAADVATRSLRFNKPDSAYLNRTPSSAGNRKIWTLSVWCKKTANGLSMPLIQANNSANPYLNVVFTTADKIRWLDGGARGQCLTDAVFRDNSAWYHIVCATDTTLSTATDRVKIYVNGVRQDVTFPTTVTQNLQTEVNNTTEHRIGRWRGTVNNYLNGYLADYYLIDGSALQPTDFGAFDSNGVWQAAEYSGTFGTNGFHLKFADASSDSALGTDSSGNSNTWTVNNITAKAPGDYDSPKHFDVVTYTGSGSTKSISSLNFQPDFVWIKQRNSAADHNLFDSVRGAQKRLFSNNTNAEGTISSGLTSFDSDGWTMGSSGNINGSSNTYVAWCWKAGGTAVSNTDGTITSSVSANADYGFSIATISSATGSSTASIGHGLNAQPKLVIQKSRTNTYGWQVYFNVSGTYKYLSLSSTDAASSTTTANMGITPTSTTVGLGSNFTGSNDYVYYCWSEVSGFSKFGSYSGGTNPNTIVTGFKPRFVLIKRIDSAASHYVWMMYDSARGGTKKLAANYNSEENESGNIGSDTSNVIEFVSNGFKHTKTNAATNASGGTYIYMAFAGTPAGEEDDSVFDVPTNGTQSDTGAGGEVSGNYAVMNALVKGSGTTLDNGNLDVAATGSAWNSVFGTIFVSSGKYYAEVAAIDVDSDYSTKRVGVGFARSTTNLSSTASSYLGADALSGAYFSNGNAFTNNTNNNVNSSFQTGDVIGVALDMDAGTVTFYKNGVAESGTFTGLSGANCIAVSVHGSGGKASINFGQRPWAFSPPSNHVAMNTAALPTATIADGTDYFASPTWTGDGGSSVSVTTGFEPDLIWIKQRNKTYYHQLYDAVRGYGSGKALASNENVAEGYGSPATYGYVSATSSTGFTGTAGSGTPLYVNENNTTYVAWAWDAGSSTASNTDGSITSSVRANQTAGFSIVSWTGTGSAGTIGHGLNSAPELIIGKNRGNTTSWIVGAAPANDWSKVLFLNNTNALTTNGNFNDTAPTSSVFSVGTGSGLNQNTKTHTAYCISSVAGFSAVGSYVGNGSSDGPFVFTGFRPAFLMWKLSSASGGHWNIEDNGRSPVNPVTVSLRANTTEADLTTSQGQIVDLLSNGFKVKNTSGQHNTSGATYIYWAVAENPFSSNGGLAR